MNNICFLNSEKKWGGGEKWHFKMSALFSKLGYNVVLAGNVNSELVVRAKNDGRKVCEIKIGRYSFLNPFRIYKIYRFFREKNIDTLFMNSSTDLKLCFWPSKLAKVENVIYRRGMPHPIKNSFLNRVIFSKMLTKVIVNSKEIEKSIFINNNKIISKEKVVLLYNGVDKDDYIQTDAKLYEDNTGCVVFGNLGRLVEQKGQIHLIEAAKILKEKGYRFKILIAGKGNSEQFLKAKIREYRLEQEVILLGFINKIEKFMNSIDVFVFPSYFEGSANAILEAMFFSKPAICFNVSSMPELVEDTRTGYLAEYKSTESFAGKMEEFITNPALIEKMGKTAKEVVDDYDILVLSKKLEKLILEG